jgi:hypothetical protein
VSAGTLHSSAVNTGTVNATTVNTTSLTSGSFGAGVVSAGTLHSSAVNTGIVNATTVNTTSLTSGSFGAGVVSAGTLHSSAVNTGTVNATTVNTTSLTSGSFGAGVVSAGTLHSSAVNTGTVNATTVNTTSLTSGSFGAGVVSAGTLQTSTVNTTSLTSGSFGAAVVSAGTLQSQIVNASTVNATTLTSSNLGVSVITTGTLFVGGIKIDANGGVSSQWINGESSSISYTSGNVIVNNFSVGNVNALSVTSSNIFGSLVTIDGLFVTSVGSHLIPSGNEVFDLGTSSNRWRDLYLSGNTINLGDSQIKTTNGNILLDSVNINGNLNMSNSTTYTYDNNWVSRGSAADNSWVSVCWAAELGLFCAVSESGTGNRIMTSSDGTNWTTRVSPANNNWSSVCWSPELNRFCAIASSGTGNRVMTSSNGIDWVTRGSAADNDWRSVCWSAELGLFCAVASGGTSNRVMTSPNGFDWTIRTSVGSNNSWQSICWSKDLRLFCAVGSYEIMTSSNGSTWTLTALNSLDCYSVTWSPDLRLFCVVGGTPAGTQNRATSSNGTSWTLRGPNESVYYRSISWSDDLGLFCAVTWSGVSDPVITSSDGINWTRRSAINRQWRGICWSGELGIFCAVAVSGTGDRVMTSSAVMTNVGNSSIITKNQILSPIGKATTPGISFIGNTNTGIFRPSNDTIALSTTGLERMRITNNGNVGIGTTNPQGMLHIFNTNSGIAGLTLEGGYENYSTQPFIRFGAPAIASATNGYAYISTNLVGTGAAGQGGQLNLFTKIANSANYSGITINQGNIGIGTSNPQCRLEVQGAGGGTIDFSVNGRMRSNNNDGGLWVSTDRFMGGLDTNKIGFYNGNWRFVVQNNGNIGIGTNNPQARLQINDPVDNIYSAINSRSVRIFGEAVDSGHDATVVINSTSPFAFNRGASIALGGRMFNYGGGEQHATYARIKGVQRNNDNAYFGHFVIETQNSGGLIERVRVNENGTMFINGATVTTSDYRIKKNIEDIEDTVALIDLRKIEPKTYKYIETEKTNEKVYGFLAQQIEEVLPYAVYTSERYVPNIYCKANVLKNQDNKFIINISENKPIILENQDNLRFEALNLSNKKIYKIKIHEVVDNLTYTTEDEIEEGEYFVFGQIVNNFKNIDKDAIFTVAVAALQEVDRQLQDTKTELETTKTQLQNANQTIQTQNEKITSIINFIQSKYPNEFVI